MKRRKKFIGVVEISLWDHIDISDTYEDDRHTLGIFNKEDSYKKKFTFEADESLSEEDLEEIASDKFHNCVPISALGEHWDITFSVENKE